MNIQLTDELKVDTQLIALRYFLNIAEQQEYFDWANKLLKEDVFFHELAVIVSIEYQEPNVFTSDDLNENLVIAFRKLGFNYDKHHAFDEYKAYDDLTYLYCCKVINDDVDYSEVFEEIHWLNYDNFQGEVNVWFFLFDRFTSQKDNPTYQKEVLQTMKDYIHHYENGKVTEFYNEWYKAKL